MSHHQYPTELHTICDVVRWAMSEMERFDVSLGLVTEVGAKRS